MYIAVLGSTGWKPLAVTTSFHINFLKKPAARALEECRLLKPGKRLAVGEIWVHSEGEGDPVALQAPPIRSPTVERYPMVLLNRQTNMLNFMALIVMRGIDPGPVLG